MGFLSVTGRRDKQRPDFEFSPPTSLHPSCHSVSWRHREQPRLCCVSCHGHALEVVLRSTGCDKITTSMWACRRKLLACAAIVVAAVGTMPICYSASIVDRAKIDSCAALCEGVKANEGAREAYRWSGAPASDR